MRRPITVPRVAILDFETKPIERRPEYPPQPTSMSFKLPWEKKARAYAWAHPVANNCTWAVAKSILLELWNGVRQGWLWVKTNVLDGILFQNGKFDIDVAEVHAGVPRLHWSKYHELQFLLFFNNPHSHNLQLKSQARELLDIEPEEKDEAVEWLQDHYGKGFSKKLGRQRDPDPRPYLPGRAPGEHPKPERIKWYAMLSLCPGDLVGRLAIGDVDRTDKLFRHLYSKIVKAGMLEAYNRRMQLMLILLDNEREGVRVDLPLLRSDVAKYQRAMTDVEAWLRKRLKSPKLNFNNDEDFAEALAANNLVDESAWVWTKGRADGTGKKRSVSKKNLTPDMVNDPKVAQMYGYRNRLFTCLGTFMLTWLRQAEAMMAKTGVPTIHTTWKMAKASDHGGGDAGAATGRLSSSPNFQNIPKTFEGKGDGYTHPKWSSLPELPLMRKYLVPDEGHVMGSIDYDGQELRILAHFEDGEMAEEYRTNPKYKVHKIVHEGMPGIIGVQFPYQSVKNFDFQVVYGGGVPAVAEALKCDVATARKAIAALKVLLPGYEALNESVKARGKAGDFVRCWGGRVYYCEPKSYSVEYQRWMSYEYKLLNYLIQGSAADCTIEAIIRYANHPDRQARFLLQVHDQILISMPKQRVHEEMEILRECMESVGLVGGYGKWVKPHPDNFDVPMLSAKETGPRWSELKPLEEPESPKHKAKVIEMKKRSAKKQAARRAA